MRLWDLQLSNHLSPSIHSLPKLLVNQMLISKGKEEKNLTQINWSFDYHSQIFLVNNLQAIGCSWSVHFISSPCSCYFCCMIAHWTLPVVAWKFVVLLSCILYLQPRLLLQLNALQKWWFLSCLNAHNPWWRVCSLHCDSFWSGFYFCSVKSSKIK